MLCSLKNFNRRTESVSERERESLSENKILPRDSVNNGDGKARTFFQGFDFI